jgi:hypothetical protein
MREPEDQGVKSRETQEFVNSLQAAVAGHGAGRKIDSE